MPAAVALGLEPMTQEASALCAVSARDAES